MRSRSRWSPPTGARWKGHFDDYVTYLRTNFAPLNNEMKKQGLILDWKMYVMTPAQPSDADIYLCELYSSYGKALDYSKADDDKAKAVAAAHYKTADEDKQDEMAKPRYEYRDILGTTYFREVTLRPMP